MIETIQDAKTALESAGLYASWNHNGSLLIAGSLRDTGDGIQVSNDACALLQSPESWVAVFPAAGLRTYEMPGSLDELVTVILATHQHHRLTECPWNEVFAQVVGEADRFLSGESLARA